MAAIYLVAVLTTLNFHLSQQFLYPEDSQRSAQVSTNPPIIYPQDTRLSYVDPNNNPNLNSYHSNLNNNNNYDKNYNNYNSFSSLSPKETIITEGVLNLTLAVNKALSALKRGDADVTIYSPVGISSALALVLLGSNGKTFREIASIMGLASGLDIESSSSTVHEQLGRLLTQLQNNNNLDYGVNVNLATAVFVQQGYPIRPVYQQMAKNTYKSDIITVDFSNAFSGTEHTINSWVREKTRNKINNILSQTPPTSTKVILCSALYFIGQWEKPFFDGLTKRRPFFPHGRKSKYSIQAEMMSNGGQFPYYKDARLNCEILGFPYKGNKTTMYIVMPIDSNKQKLNYLESQLTPSELERLVKSTRYQKTVILFPKMKLESTLDLTDALQYIGARSLFNKHEANLALLSSASARSAYGSNTFSQDPQRQAAQQYNQPSGSVDYYRQQQDFTQGLVVTRLHQSVRSDNQRSTSNSRSKRQIGETIDSVRQALNSNPYNENVDNPGLYADQVLHKVYMDITETGTEAAAATSVSLSRGGDAITFRVDHPFLFFIIDEETKLVLFWGSVTTPTPSFS